jgi:uncharacterized protein YndB with AHSA1/START domain
MKSSEVDEPIVVECELEEPREKVWRALTVPEIVAEWLNPDGTAPLAPNYEIVTAERPHRLQYRLREGEDAVVESTVTFELSETPLGGTRLRVVHEDFERVETTAAQPGVLYAIAYPRPATNRRSRRTRMIRLTARTTFKAAA